jgi:hypothetical protein
MKRMLSRDTPASTRRSMALSALLRLSKKAVTSFWKDEELGLVLDVINLSPAFVTKSSGASGS